MNDFRQKHAFLPYKVRYTFFITANAKGKIFVTVFLNMYVKSFFSRFYIIIVAEYYYYIIQKKNIKAKENDIFITKGEVNKYIPFKAFYSTQKWLALG